MGGGGGTGKGFGLSLLVVVTGRGNAGSPLMSPSFLSIQLCKN